MLLQIRQVITTYTTHRIAMAVILLSFASIVCPSLYQASHSTHIISGPKVQMLSLTLAMPIFFLSPFLVGHVKSQFAHSRARLVPSFSPAHLLVIFGLLFLLLVLYPLLTAYCTGFSALGLTALAIAVATPAIWGVHLARGPWMLVSLAAIYSLLTDWGQHCWVIDAAAHGPALALISVVGIALIAAWLVRLYQLHEELPDYQTTMQWNWGRRSDGEVSEQRRIVAQQAYRQRFISWCNDLLLARTTGYHDDRALSIPRLLRYGFGPQPVEIMATFMAIWFLAISLFLAKIGTMQQGGIGALWFFIQISIIWPGGWASQQLVQRRPRMAMELLRPIERQRYFDSLLTASAWNTVIAWVVFNVALAVGVLLTIEEPITPMTVAMYALLSASICFTEFGIAVRTAIWKSLAARLAVLLGSMLLLMLPLAGWWAGRNEYGDLPFVALALVLVGIGAALVALARSAWSRAEFA